MKKSIVLVFRKKHYIFADKNQKYNKKVAKHMAQTSAQSTVNKIEMRLKGKGRGSIVFQLLWCTHERTKKINEGLK